eukprot:scaffold13700_cov136-Isochrysis_galbana.AAC.2
MHPDALVCVASSHRPHLHASASTSSHLLVCLTLPTGPPRPFASAPPGSVWPRSDGLDQRPGEGRAHLDPDLHGARRFPAHQSAGAARAQPDAAAV